MFAATFLALSAWVWLIPTYDGTFIGHYVNLRGFFRMAYVVLGSVGAVFGTFHLFVVRIGPKFIDLWRDNPSVTFGEEKTNLPVAKARTDK